MREGKSEHQGWLRYKFSNHSVFKRAYFVIRGEIPCDNLHKIRAHFLVAPSGGWLSHYESELMDDPGVRLVKLSYCQVSPASSASAFDLIAADGTQLNFECGTGEIDTDFRQPSLSKEADGTRRH